jgi:hypothetical protein
MKKLLLTLLAMTLIAGMVFILGCSDDDEDKGTGPVAGDTADVEFQVMSELLGDGILDHDGNILFLSIWLMDIIPGKSDGYNPFKPLAPAQDLDSLSWTYNSSNFWHIFSVTAVFIDSHGEGMGVDTLTYIGIDSIRFVGPLGPMLYPDTTVTTIDIRAHFDVEISSENASVTISTDASFDLTEADMGIYVNGTSSDSGSIYISDEEINCEVDYTTNQTVTDLYLDYYAIMGEGCPLGGTISVVASVDIGCVSDTMSVDITGTWWLTFTFNDGMITATYTNGQIIWTVTEPCYDGGAKKSIWGISRID